MVNADNNLYNEFLEIVEDLIYTPEFRKLDECSHHYGVSRMQHCINVAYYSFVVCKKLQNMRFCTPVSLLKMRSS